MSDLCMVKPKCKRNHHNIFCNDIRSMRFYIHAFSAMDHSNYCLAYAFTYRDMQDFQGIAWIKVIRRFEVRIRLPRKLLVTQLSTKRFKSIENISTGLGKK